MRRHHARLAHEIALFGFPGLRAGWGESEFPALGGDPIQPLTRLADLVGLTARSHGLPLRVCTSYLNGNPQYRGTPRPMGCAAAYPMALLRVADYLQLDRQRAPAVLLQLKNPQSPLSVQECEKHRVVDYIGSASDPKALNVTVSPNTSLTTYLQVDELLVNLQLELDNSEAVLSEQYGSRQDLKLDKLHLSIHRIISNIKSPEFCLRLPFVPRRIGFSADPHILSLLVEPLYGQHPGVGVRELVQNSTDAVRERIFWCAKNPSDLNRCNFRKLGCDVLVEFIKVSGKNWRICVSDNGIEMTADTLEKYFLRAGSSYRYSSIWEKTFVGSEGRPGVLRSGRFGIGAFAIFLLGPTFRLLTRLSKPVIQLE